MKLKYYLRGLGTGILFATLILFISYSYHYSDAKIKERAKELGMVETESHKQSMLDDITTVNKTTTTNNSSESLDETTPDDETSKDETTSEEETTTKKQEVTTTKKQEVTTTKKQEETTTKKQEVTTTKKQEVTTTKQEEVTTTKENITTTKPVEEETTTNGGTRTEYVITVTRGMSSEKVAEALRIAGAIEDAKDFNRYLISNGYSEKIRVGTFTIPAGSTYKEIAEIIA